MKIYPFVDLHAQYKRIEKEIDSEIKRVLNSSDFILGKDLEIFEKKFAAYIGVKYCIGIDSGTSALELGLQALGISKRDEVITPVNSFFASSVAISLIGGVPIWVDSDPKTYTIDVSQIEKKISKKTKAIMPVHLYGQSAEMDVIIKIARKYKLYIIEDACQAHGAEYKNKKVGTFGDIGVFSFYPGKNLGAYGDGGAIVTNSKTMYEKVLKLRNYGQQKKYHHDFIAGNKRLDSLQAAILSVKLDFLNEWNSKRRKLAGYYMELLKDLPLVLPYTASLNTHVFHLFVIRTQKRDNLKAFLMERGIHTGIHYPIPIYRQKAYKDIAGITDCYFPVADKQSKQLLSLPLYPELHKNDVKLISKQIRDFFNEST